MFHEVATKLLATATAAEARAQTERAAFEARIAAIEKLSLYTLSLTFGLLRISVVIPESDCIITAEALKLPQLTGEPTLEQRRAQIREFFGVM
ncbi:hypothetical protein C0992_006108 [Termitomyces sp. T32_za158]|nr:hypothetical protein C0992_006108 [Termitomyces sp. T32_za158]